MWLETGQIEKGKKDDLRKQSNTIKGIQVSTTTTSDSANQTLVVVPTDKTDLLRGNDFEPNFFSYFHKN